jgi:hypothetical protein
MTPYHELRSLIDWNYKKFEMVLAPDLKPHFRFFYFIEIVLHFLNTDII